MLVSRHGCKGVERDVVKIAYGVGETECDACEGSGIFDGCPDGPQMCVECKGTGKILVSI